MKRPMGAKKAKNERQKARQQFMEAQSEGAEKITAALLTIDKDSEERARQAREGQRQRDEVMCLYLEEENNRSKEDHELKKASRRTNLLKDLIFVTGELKEAYKQMDLIDHRLALTPRERFDYETIKKLVEAQHTELNRLVVVCVSPKPCTPQSRATTVGMTPRRLDEEFGNADLGID